jgi:hypothetical protein
MGDGSASGRSVAKADVERGPERSEGDAQSLMQTMIMKLKPHCRWFGSRDCDRRE